MLCHVHEHSAEALKSNLVFKFIPQLEAFIDCGRLRSAYIVAVRSGQHKDVRRVGEVATLSGQNHVATMCNKWLSNYSRTVNPP